MSEAFRKAAGTDQTDPPPAGKKDKDPTAQLFEMLDTRRSAFLTLLPKSIDIDQFLGVIKTAVLNTPDLVFADRRTLITACMTGAQKGLMPDGKEAVLNIYNTKVKGPNGEDRWIKKVQFLPMWGGMVKKLYESGQVTYVDGAAVYERDVFEFERGEEPKLRHKPTGVDEPGPVIAAYVVIKMKNGEVKREVMWRRDIERVRKVSKSATGPGWTDWYDQFAIKAVGKRAFKQIPSIPDLMTLVELDNAAMAEGDDAAAPAPAQGNRPEDIGFLALGNDPSPDATFVGGGQDAEREPTGSKKEEKSAKRTAKKEPSTDADPKPAADQKPSTPPPPNDEMAELKYSDYQTALEGCDDADRAHELMESARALGILSEPQLAKLQVLADKVK